jgi:hypothetical protein
MVDMRYLKTINEMLIDNDDRKNFISEITSIFIDEVVDNSNIEELPYDLEEIDGLYYDIVEIFLAVDLPDPYLEIGIWSSSSDDFLSIKKQVINFIEKLQSLGFIVEYHKQIGLQLPYESWEKRSINDIIRAHAKYINEYYDSDSFDIKIYY